MANQLKHTYQEWLNDLAAQSAVIANLGLSPSGNMEGLAINLANCEEHSKLIVSAVEKLNNRFAMTTTEPAITECNLKVLLENLLSNKNCSGAFCQLAAYGWLQNFCLNIIEAETPVSDVLGKNSSTLDGECELNFAKAYFDVKEFGFNEKLAKKLQQKLQSHFNETGEQVFVEGNYALSTHEFQELLGKHKAIAQELKNKKLIQHKGLTIQLKEKRLVSISHYSSTPYELAERNALLPFKYAHQFTAKAPFILIFVIHPWIGSLSLSGDFGCASTILTRSLARRTFMQFSEDKHLIKDVLHDKKIRDNISFADASKLLSAIIFINVWPKKLDQDRQIRPSWIYLNPRATHILKRSEFDLVFANSHHDIVLDDFCHDNY